MTTTNSQTEVKGAGPVPASGVGSPGAVAPAQVQYQNLGPEALGKLASQISGNPVTLEAAEQVRAEIKKMWAATEPADSERREGLYHDMRALDALMSKIGRIAAAGRSAAVHQERLNHG